jgi:hypothetical protein
VVFTFGRSCLFILLAVAHDEGLSSLT